MYEAYFGLDTLPFSPATTLENTYRSKELKEALTHISYTIENREPFLLLTGEVGCGKTTSIQVAVRKYCRTMSISTLSHTTLTPRELLEAIAIGFKMRPGRMQSKPKLMQQLEAHFSRCMDSGRPALLFFDEAHLLKPPVLEELRLFSNLTRNGKNLVQIVLVGQPELEQRVKRNRSLRQRISVRYRLGPLSREETGQYISHRLGAAGNPKTSEIFSDEAIDAVHRLSRGLPRQINVIAGYSMMTCFAGDCPRVNAGHVESVKQEYGFEDVTPTVDPVADSSHVETAIRSDESMVAVEKNTVQEGPEDLETENEADEERPEPWPNGTSFPRTIFSLDFPKTTLTLIGLLIVAFVFVAWMFLPGSHSIGDDADVRKSALQTDSLRSIPNQDLQPAARPIERKGSANTFAGPGPVENDADELAAGSGQENQQPVARKPPRDEEVRIVIQRDKALVEFPSQPTTVQIAAILDPELADRSLAKATSKTNIPGIIETVPSGETTWYLVLLGCFDSAHDAQVAVDSSKKALREMGVTEIRIKPAPRWLRERLADRSASRANPLK